MRKKHFLAYNECIDVCIFVKVEFHGVLFIKKKINYVESILIFIFSIFNNECVCLLVMPN